MIVEAGTIHIRLKFSFVAAVTLMLYFCEERIVLNAFFASLIHECGHLVFMLIYKAEPYKIELGAFGICIERREATLLSYKKEALIALGGIIFNLTVCFLSRLLSEAVLKDELVLFAAVNLLVALFNSLPSFFLDMGRALNFLFLAFTEEERVNRIMSLISAVTSLVLTFFFVLYTIFVGFNISLLAVTLYLNLITFKRKVDK